MEDDVISLGQVFQTLRKHIIMIIFFAIAGLLVAAGVTYFVMTPMYDSSALILVNQKENTSPAMQYNAVQTDLQMINTYNLDYSPRYLGHEIASGRSESNVWSVANTD